MSFPDFSMINSYAVLTALEREIGRPRVRAMAEAYLAATLPPIQVPVPGSLAGFATGPAPGGGPITPPGYDYGPRVPAPRTDALGAPPPLGLAAGGYSSPLPSPVLGPSASGLESPPATPPRLAAAPTEAPGAPARPLRSRGGLGLMQGPREEDGDRMLEELMYRTDPEHPLLCPRHQHIPLNLPLGPSRNSSGQWGMYVPPGTNCRNCQADDAEDAGR